ncbi:YciI family protein [Leisingera thetidis]|uniref:YciI family protein n=1 Tax=Leisingera thetidis TaxID=2930199 RepID=UPI0021F751D4|nr:YciI family protein [Leisingera thetidis]
MHVVVHALDKPDAVERRLSHLAAHRAYLDTAPDAHGLTVLLSGPLTIGDQETMTGSFFLLEAPHLEAVDEMIAQDPLRLANVWETVRISKVLIRQNKMGDSG